MVFKVIHKAGTIEKVSNYSWPCFLSSDLQTDADTTIKTHDMTTYTSPARWIIIFAISMLIAAQAQTKHKLEKWFIISDDGVRPSVLPSVRTKQNKPIKELNHFSS